MCEKNKHTIEKLAQQLHAIQEEMTRAIAEEDVIRYKDLSWKEHNVTQSILNLPCNSSMEALIQLLVAIGEIHLVKNDVHDICRNNAVEEQKNSNDLFCIKNRLSMLHQALYFVFAHLEMKNGPVDEKIKSYLDFYSPNFYGPDFYNSNPYSPTCTSGTS